MTDFHSSDSQNNEDFNEVASSVKTLKRDQIQSLSAEGTFCAIKMAEILYSAIRQEASENLISTIKYLLVNYHPDVRHWHIDWLMDSFEEEVKNSLLGFSEGQ
jgi:hypothetical protein